MERTIELAKIISLAALVVIALLCLSYSNAYGYSAAVGIQKPVMSNTSGNNGTPEIKDSKFVGNNADDDSYVGSGDNSANILPPTTVPEPGTLILLGTGLVGLARYARRRS